jgi:hypothetical protein
MNPLKKEMQRGLNALYLEVPKSIVDDVQKRVNAYVDDIEAKLLACCRNLGNPSYGHSSSTTIEIDEIREEMFDLLDIPKS